jgi:hypothetical protein
MTLHGADSSHGNWPICDGGATLHFILQSPTVGTASTWTAPTTRIASCSATPSRGPSASLVTGVGQRHATGRARPHPGRRSNTGGCGRGVGPWDRAKESSCDCSCDCWRSSWLSRSLPSSAAWGSGDLADARAGSGLLSRLSTKDLHRPFTLPAKSVRIWCPTSDRGGLQLAAPPRSDGLVLGAGVRRCLRRRTSFRDDRRKP